MMEQPPNNWRPQQTQYPNWQQQPSPPQKPPATWKVAFIGAVIWYRTRRRKTRFWLAGITIVLLMGLMGGCLQTLGMAGANTTASIAATPPPTTVPVLATTAPTSQATARPTTQPAAKPTAQPTQAPRPVPTVYVQPTAVPTQAPQPTQETGVYGNPWGYDFNAGNLIYSPPATFCTYFPCVTTFSKDTSGYVVECGNGEFSHSGGVRGACSRDGDVSQILYSH